MAKRGNIAESKVDPFIVVIYTTLTLLAILILAPFYNVVIVSFSPMVEYVRTPFLLFPQDPTLQNYRDLLSGGTIGIGYRSTALLVVIGVPINILLTTLTSYALCKNDLPGRRFFILYILITMLFSGGVIPLYLVVRDLGLINSIWSVIWVGACNTFYLILTRNYFLSLPASLKESAHIDGASELTIFFRIVLPLSLPIIATVTLFVTVDKWNEWFYPLLFIHRSDIRPLQVVLRNIINNAQITIAGSGQALDQANAVRAVKGMQMAAIMLTMGPIMCVYPFLQKHFNKGIMVGAIKA